MSCTNAAFHFMLCSAANKAETLRQAHGTCRAAMLSCPVHAQSGHARPMQLRHTPPIQPWLPPSHLFLHAQERWHALKVIAQQYQVFEASLQHARPTRRLRSARPHAWVLLARPGASLSLTDEPRDNITPPVGAWSESFDVVCALLATADCLEACCAPTAC